MKSCAVKSCVKRNLYVVNECVLIGSGVNTVGIKALVKHKALEHGFAVKPELYSVKANTAKAEITFNLIFSEFKLKVIKLTVADIPKMLFFKVKVKADAAALGRSACRTHYFAVKKRNRLKFTLADNCCVYVKRAVFGIGVILNIIYICFRRCLNPYRLPNARCAGIEAVVRSVII